MGLLFGRFSGPSRVGVGGGRVLVLSTVPSLATFRARGGFLLVEGASPSFILRRENGLLFLERRWPWDLVPQPKVVGWLGSWAPRNPKTWR